MSSLYFSNRNVGISLLLVTAFLFSTSQAATRHMRTPKERSGIVLPNDDKTTDVTKGKPDTKLDTRIIDATSPSTSDNESKGNRQGGLKTKSREPMDVQYTISEMRETFPWITKPGSRRKRSILKKLRSATDGLSRFNNPSYLCERLEGLEHGSCGFKPKQGMKATTSGKFQVRLEQLWRGIPVYGFSMVLEQEKDANLILESADGQFLSGIEEDITSEVPAISREDAINRAVAYNDDSGKRVENPSAELVVDTIGDKAILVYMINYFISGENQLPKTSTGKRPWVVMDANTGQVYKEWEGLASIVRMENIDVLTGLQSHPKRYGVIMTRVTDTDECYYQKALSFDKYLTVKDKVVQGTMSVYDWPVPCDQVAEADYELTNGAQSPKNTAYKWAGDMVSFLTDIVLSAISVTLYVEVHHEGQTSLWNGHAIFLGDGDKEYYPMIGPDVIAHEVAHAFTEGKTRLKYSGQSAAIDESYADMAACAFMSQVTEDISDDVYKIGGSVTKSGKALRDMCYPRNPELMEYDPHRPIIEHATDYQWGVDAHNASALYSKVFCELSKLDGWDIKMAFKVFTMANLVYWGPSETFESGACGVRKAAWAMLKSEQALQDVADAFSSASIFCPIDQEIT